MFIIWTPHKTALVIAWTLLAGWCGLAYAAIGKDWFIPSAWPILFVVAISIYIIRWERRIFRTIDAGSRSQRYTDSESLVANLDQPPEKGP